MHPNNYELKIERRQSARSVTGEKHPNTSRDVNTENNPDITNKIRDTADRINGLERPKPNEGYALTSGISKTSIHNSRGNVKARGKGGVYYSYQGQRLNKLHLTAAQRMAVDFSERLAKKWNK